MANGKEEKASKIGKSCTMQVGSNFRYLCIIYASVSNSWAESFISKIVAIAKREGTSNIEQLSLEDNFKCVN